MLPAHARGRAQWLADARVMLEAGKKAFAAAKAKDLAALEALNDELYQSCVTCHQHFRPGYGKRPGR
jgi:cytochrome c556